MESSTGKRQSRGYETLDDASSMTSMSSTSTSTLCHVCRKPGDPVVLPLIKCISCPGRWHTCCHNPNITDWNKEFTCARCEKKKATKASSPPSRLRHQSISSSNLGLSSGSSSPKKQQTSIIRCSIPKCGNLPQNDPKFGKIMCKQHAVAEQQRINSSRPHPKLVPPTRKIDKAKLYVFKPEDLPARQSRKRKRSGPLNLTASSIENGISSSTKSPDLLREGREPKMMDPPRKNGRSPSIDRPLAAYASVGEIGRGHSNSFTPINTPILGHPGPVNQSPMGASLSPSYEPPSPKPIDGLHSSWGNDDSELDSPGSQITNELVNSTPRVTPNMTDQATHTRHPYKSPYVTSEQDEEDTIDRNANFAHKDAEEERETSPHLRSFNTRQNKGKGKSSIDSTSGDAPTEMNRKHAHTNGTAPTLSEDGEPPTAPPPHPNSIAARRLSSKPFNPSTLDSYLLKQSQSSRTRAPTPTQLLDTQLWGHINPATTWPPEFSPEYLAHKQHVISLRPSRKSNFGKVLREHNFGERREKGWNTHQVKDVGMDEKETEGIELLFGVRSGDFEPSIRGGELVMIEKERDGDDGEGEEEGEKNGRRAFCKVYRVS